MRSRGKVAGEEHPTASGERTEINFNRHSPIDRHACRSCRSRPDKREVGPVERIVKARSEVGGSVECPSEIR